MSLIEKIDKNRLPKHIAVIMDGNGRWAKSKGLERIFGHRNGVKAVRETVEGAAELGVSYVTLYAFSSENWNRPKKEVDALMTLLIGSLKKEMATFQKNKIRLKAIGELQHLPANARKELDEVIETTSVNEHMTLVLALSYGSKLEIVNAVKAVAQEVKEGRLQPEQIDEAVFEQYLYTDGMPHPELLIRTSGEERISNFLLWQIAYAELYFTPTLWPDFRKKDLHEAIINFQNRERRFGKTSEQISK
jgi:undecaprenyl diphosphate synthase